MKRLLAFLIAAVGVVAVSCYATEPEAAAQVAAEAAAAVEQKSAFCGTFWALAPALFAIVLALLSKEVYSSLFAGVVLGAFVSGCGGLLLLLMWWDLQFCK